MSKDGFLLWGLRLCAALSLGVFALFFFWTVVDRSAPIHVQGGEVVRYERQADGAWLIIIRWHGERYRSCWGTSKRWITDSNQGSVGLVLPLEDIAYPPDFDIPQSPFYEWEVPIHIPAYFESAGHTSGAYKIRILYACNPIQEHVFPIVVEPPAVTFTLPVGQFTRP